MMRFADLLKAAACLAAAAALAVALLYVYAVPLASAPMWAAVAASVLGWAVSLPFTFLFQKAPART